MSCAPYRVPSCVLRPSVVPFPHLEIFLPSPPACHQLVLSLRLSFSYPLPQFAISSPSPPACHQLALATTSPPTPACHQLVLSLSLSLSCPLPQLAITQLAFATRLPSSRPRPQLVIRATNHHHIHLSLPATLLRPCMCVFHPYRVPSCVLRPSVPQSTPMYPPMSIRDHKYKNKNIYISHHIFWHIDTF